MITLTVTGNLMSKSNSRIITKFGGRPRLIKKPKAIDYVEGALYQLQEQLRGHQTILGPVRMDITIWYDSRRPDLDVSLIQDILEKAGVYKNDRQVFEIHAAKKLDKENPRLQVTITEIE